MVEATISYLAAMPERPFFFLYDPPPGTPWRNTRGDRRPMPIRDARQLDPPPSLDREGFTLVRRVTAVEDLYDEEGGEGRVLPRARDAGEGCDRRGARRRLRPQPALRHAGARRAGTRPVRPQRLHGALGAAAGPGPARRGGRAAAPRPVRRHQRLEADSRSRRAGAARGVRRAHD